MPHLRGRLLGVHVHLMGRAPDVASLADLVVLQPDDGPGRPCAVEDVDGVLTLAFESQQACFSGARRALEAASWLELLCAATTDRYCVIHASVVSWRNRAVVLPGRSMSGKSSLCEALVRAGALYLSDEYALLDAAGAVHPYPRRPRLRPAGGGVASSEVLSPSAFDAWPVGGACPAGAVAALQHGSDEPRTAVSEAEAALLLIDNAVPAQLRPRWTLDRCTAAASGTFGWRGGRGGAEETAQLLLAELDEVWNADQDSTPET